MADGQRVKPEAQGGCGRGGIEDTGQGRGDEWWYASVAGALEMSRSGWKASQKTRGDSMMKSRGGHVIWGELTLQHNKLPREMSRYCACCSACSYARIKTTCRS
jgi:hypothetical protein